MALNLTQKQKSKWLILYVSVMCILICLISVLQWFELTSFQQIFYYIAQLLVLIVGIIHLIIMPKILIWINKNFWQELIVTLVILIASLISALIIYYFLKLDFVFATFICAFALPFICFHTYKFFLKIPEPIYSLWFYPVDEEMPDLDMIDTSQVQLVTFIFPRNTRDNKLVEFTSKAPINMKLGELFFYFIASYNEKYRQQPIEYLMGDNKPYGWRFYRKNKWFNRKYFFDFDSSFRQNNIRPSEFIYALRYKNLPEHDSN